MRRRLDLAAALVHGPRVLFLDEPTTGLDPVSRKTIWEEVERLNDEGTTVFLTTQYLEEADQLADNVGIIDNGRIVAEGTPEALKSEIGHPHLEVRLTDGRDERADEILSRFGKRLPAKGRPCWSSWNAAPGRWRRSSAPSTTPGSPWSRSTSSSRPSTTSSSPRPATTWRATRRPIRARRASRG